MAVEPDRLDAPESLDLLLRRNDERLLTCVHCGLCLPACPTYRALGNENDSPRGRIYLMRAAVEGSAEWRGAVSKHIDLCLGCRACEPVCPSGVPYGQLLEAARSEVSKANGIGSLPLRTVLNGLFTRPRLLRLAMRIVRWFRDTSFARLAFEGGLIGGRARFALGLLLSSKPFFDEGALEPERNARSVSGRHRVALLRGCVMDGLFEHVNRATERVLERNGVTVCEVAEQVCCGALHAHAGELETAQELARKNIDAFLSSGCDHVVVNAAGCGAAMKAYGELLAGDPAYHAKAEGFSSKVRDISEMLAETGIERPSDGPKVQVAYDAPCHLIHAQRVDLAPREMIAAIPSVEMVPLEGSETCCGGAGIYNLQHAWLSLEILEGKLERIARSGAEVVATGNPGCIMQIGAGLKLEGSAVPVVHPVELLDAAYRMSDSHIREEAGTSPDS